MAVDPRTLKVGDMIRTNGTSYKVINTNQPFLGGRTAIHLTSGEGKSYFPQTYDTDPQGDNDWFPWNCSELVVDDKKVVGVNPKTLKVGDKVIFDYRERDLVSITPRPDIKEGVSEYLFCCYGGSLPKQWIDLELNSHPWTEMALIEPVPDSINPKTLKVGDKVVLHGKELVLEKIGKDGHSCANSLYTFSVDGRTVYFSDSKKDKYPWIMMTRPELPEKEKVMGDVTELQKEIDSLQVRLNQQIAINADLRNNIDDLNDNINTMKMNIDELTEQNTRLFKLGQFLESENDSLDGLVMYYRDIEVLQNSRIENYISRIKQLKQE